MTKFSLTTSQISLVAAVFAISAATPAFAADDTPNHPGVSEVAAPVMAAAGATPSNTCTSIALGKVWNDPIKPPPAGFDTCDDLQTASTR